MNSHCCSICLENIYFVEEEKIFSCNHYFHEKCIKTWNGSCPNCRANRITIGSNDFGENLLKIYPQISVSNIRSIYYNKWQKQECIKEYHKISFVRTYGVVGICETCSNIECFNLMH